MGIGAPKWKRNPRSAVGEVRNENAQALAVPS